MKNYKRFFLYLTAVFVMALAGSQVITNAQVAAVGARCCTYGSDCATDMKCCAPGANEADCSQNRKYYCRKTCTAVIVVEPIEPGDGEVTVP